MARASRPDLETDVELEACRLVWKYLGIEGSKLKILGNTGYPDRIFWLPGGTPFLIEFKRPGEDPEPKQLHIHDQLRSLGYTVEVHDDAIQAFQAIITALEATQLPKESRKILARAKKIVRSL